MKPWKILGWSAFGGFVQGLVFAVIAVAVVVIATESGAVSPGPWRAPLLLVIGVALPVAGLALGLAEGVAKLRRDG